MRCAPKLASCDPARPDWQKATRTTCRERKKLPTTSATSARGTPTAGQLPALLLWLPLRIAPSPPPRPPGVREHCEVRQSRWRRTKNTRAFHRGSRLNTQLHPCQGERHANSHDSHNERMCSVGEGSPTQALTWHGPMQPPFPLLRRHLLQTERLWTSPEGRKPQCVFLPQERHA